MTGDPHRVDIGDLVILDQETINDIYDGDAYLGVGLVTDIWAVPSIGSAGQELHPGRTTIKVLFGDQESEWYNWQLEVVSHGLV
jgi:hypothetical protein